MKEEPLGRPYNQATQLAGHYKNDKCSREAPGQINLLQHFIKHRESPSRPLMKDELEFTALR